MSDRPETWLIPCDQCETPVRPSYHVPCHHCRKSLCARCYLEGNRNCQACTPVKVPA